MLWSLPLIDLVSAILSWMWSLPLLNKKWSLLHDLVTALDQFGLCHWIWDLASPLGSWMWPLPLLIRNGLCYMLWYLPLIDLASAIGSWIWYCPLS